MTENVNIVRLITGEEVVCKLETIEGAGSFQYRIKDAAILIPNPVDGKLMFGRWLPYTKSENGIVIESKHVMFVTDPTDDLKQHYITTILNNLAIPMKKLVEPTGSGNLKLTID